MYFPLLIALLHVMTDLTLGESLKINSGKKNLSPSIYESPPSIARNWVLKSLTTVPLTELNGRPPGELEDSDVYFLYNTVVQKFSVVLVL